MPVKAEKNVCRYAQVHLLDVPYNADKPYTYIIPESFADKVCSGSIVVVPFGKGNRPGIGVVTELCDKADFNAIKSISDVPPEDFMLPHDLAALALHMKSTVLCTVGEAVKAMLPSGISIQVVSRYVYIGDSIPEDIPQRGLTNADKAVEDFIRKSSPSFESLQNEFATVMDTEMLSSVLKKATKERRIKLRKEVIFSTNVKVEKLVVSALSEDELENALLPECTAYTEMQKDVLAIIANAPALSRAKLSSVYGIGQSVITSLIKKKALTLKSVTVNRNPYDTNVTPEYPGVEIELSDEQQSAFETLYSLYSSHEAKASLLFGVTGSGKTKVIQKLTDRCIADGKDAIILVPEIALTSQTVNLFIKRYGDRVSVIHSGLSNGERCDAWQKIKYSEGNIVIGTRSAIFAPVPNLGMIVLDEEQEASYKSDMNPKYHARDIARFRCAHSNAFMLLSSATPSLESYKKATEGIYTLVKLTTRYGNAVLPTVSISDLRESDDGDGEPKVSAKSGKPYLIGKELIKELREAYDRDEQSVLLLNKRGYNSLITCKACGYIEECPNCSVALTHHKNYYGSSGRLVCHYCGYATSIPEKCTECGSSHIDFVGTGIQMLEEELEERLPRARVLRMDLDTTSGKMGHDKLLGSFRNGEADILIGTQMVAKGHDFGRVSLVGIVLAESSLYVGDYRAPERTFSLITQVIGRAGRGNIPGKAVIQTYSPGHKVLHFAAEQDYEQFYEDEASLRSAMSFPPFCDIITVTFTSQTEAQVCRAASAFGSTLKEFAESVFKDVRMIVYGPFKAGIYKVLGKYRMKFIIKCKNSKRTRELLSTVYSEFLTQTKEHCSASIDINPSSML